MPRGLAPGFVCFITYSVRFSAFPFVNAIINFLQSGWCSSTAKHER